MKDIELSLEGLNCASCASKIEELSRKIKGVEDSNIDFISKKLRVTIETDTEYERIKSEIIAIVNKLEPDVLVVDNKKLRKKDLRLTLEGLNCASCAGKIEDLTVNLKGVESVSIDFISKKMKVLVEETANPNEILVEIRSIVNKLEPDVQVINEKTNMNRQKNYLDLTLEGLNCASCAGKIEKLSRNIQGVRSVDLDFISKKIKLEATEHGNLSLILKEVEQIVKKLEPDVVVINNNMVKSTCSDGSCNGDHYIHSQGSIKEHSSINKKGKILDKIANKTQLIQIIIAGILFALPSLLKLEGTERFIVYFISYLIIGHKIVILAFRNLLAGQAFDEHFLMTIATIGAFIVGEYPEAVMVMLLYQIGEMFQGMAVNHSRNSISALLDIRPDYANLELDGEIIQLDPEEINLGDFIIIRPGEKIPLDGVVVEGNTSLDTSNITGESLPRFVKVGDEVLSGSVNKEGLIKVQVQKEFGESTVYKILDLVENASSKKAPTENFITKFARYYTPAVVIVALGIAILPPLLMGYAFKEWIYRACVFLVISCPCALVISVPLGFFGGIGGASKAGVLIKGGNYLEALNDVDTIVFDKTGTITKGSFTVTKIESFADYSKDEILELAAYGESYSNHPIARSIVDYYGRDIKSEYISEYKEIPGKGIEVKIDNKLVILGNKKLFSSRNIDIKPVDSIGTVVYIGENDQHIGSIVVSDELKENIVSDMEKLKEVGIKNTIMLSGDNTKIAEKVGKQVGMSKVYGDLLPQDKVAKFEEIISRSNSRKKVAFVGDGVNDAPVLARADVGIAMGGVGSDAAIEASDIVIMTDEIGKISTGIKIAKNTKKIVTQNIILALGVKLIVLILGAMGTATMWEAVFADVGVSIIAIFNSIRALKVED